MERSTLFTLLVLLVLIGAGVAVYMVASSSATRGNGTATSTPNLTGRAIFTDGEHGFTLNYPEKDEVDYTFQSFYHLPANWRANALPEGTGTPIVAVIAYRTQSDHSYPRYFTAEVRIGASTDPKELARCTTAATEQNEQPLPDVVLGGTTFKAFSFESAGMMQYVKGVSYRAEHEGSCIAIEKLETGSSYRDDPKSPDDVPEEKLAAAYRALDDIAGSFAFARP